MTFLNKYLVEILAVVLMLIMTAFFCGFIYFSGIRSFDPVSIVLVSITAGIMVAIFRQTFKEDRWN